MRNLQDKTNLQLNCPLIKTEKGKRTMFKCFSTAVQPVGLGLH